MSKSPEASSDVSSIALKGFGARSRAGAFAKACVSSILSSAMTVQPMHTAWGEENLLLALTVLGVVLSVVFGLLVRMLSPSAETITLIGFPGEIFMSMLKMLILPLVISSVVSGLAQMDPKSSGKMGTRALVYYLSTTILAAILGIIVVIMFHPGDPTIKSQSKKIVQEDLKKISTFDALLDIIRNMFPENLVEACISRTETYYRNVTSIETETGRTLISTQRKLIQKDGSNMPGLIMFFTIVGIILGQMGYGGDVVVRFFVQLNEIIMRIVFIVLWYSPFGIMSLIIGKFTSVEDIGTMAAQLGVYMITTVVGLLVHSLVTLPTIYFAVTRKNPCDFYKGMLQAIFTALATASSAATLPVTFRCLEENLKIDKRVTRFVLPIGATVNMDGVALHEPIVTLFIAQVNQITLGVGDILVLILMSIVSSISAAAIPSSGIVTTLLVLTTVGVPAEDISFVIAVDWIVDRGRTAVNVLGDAFGAGIVAHLTRNELIEMDAKKAAQLRLFQSDPVINESPQSSESSTNVSRSAKI